MKAYVITCCFIFSFLSSCRPPENSKQLLQNRIDSLEKTIAETYKPGFGEFMSGIQVHHAKLWFAGVNNNWKLSAFEITEIKEALSAIKQYCSDRQETKSLTMIDGPIDSISNAIEKQDPDLFKSSYNLLTQTCNNCHQETHHEFNEIITPVNPPYSNQDFKTP